MKAKRTSSMMSTFFFTAEHKGQEIPFQIRAIREKDCDAMYLVFGHEESPQPWPKGVDIIVICFHPPGWPSVRVCETDDEHKTHLLVKFAAPSPMIKHEPWQHLEIDITFEEPLEKRSQQNQEAQEA